jgi:hypothetical protein
MCYIDGQKNKYLRKEEVIAVSWAVKCLVDKELTLRAWNIADFEPVTAPNNVKYYSILYKYL